MIFKSGTRDKVYLRMLVMLIAVIELAILSISGISYFSMKKNMLNQLYEIYVENAKKSIKDTQATIDMIDSTCIQLKYDYYIKLLCSYNQPDATQFIPALQQMTNYRRAVNSISSIYIYNSQTFFISDETTPNFIQSKNGFLDKSIVPIIDKYKDYSTLKPIPRKISDLKTGVETDGYSFLLYDKVPLGPESVVVINLKNDWLIRIIQQMKQLGSTKDLIIDEQGRVIVSDGNEKFLDALNDPYVQEVIAKSETSGYLIKKVNGQKSLVTYTKMPSLNWNFISVIPYQVASKSITGVLIKVLLICAAILFLGVGAAFYLSRKFYVPVENLLEKLTVYEVQQSDVLNENRRRFLSVFIRHSGELAEAFIKKGLDENKIDLSLTSPFILVLMKIDKSPIFSENINDKGLIKFALSNIAKELLQGKYSTETVEMSDDEMLLILNGYIDYDRDKVQIIREISEIQRLINVYFHVTVSAAISNSVAVYNNLQNTFKELQEGIKNKFFYGYSSVIHYEDFKNRARIRYCYQEHKAKEIIAALTSGKSEKAKEMYMEMIKELEACNYEAFQIYSTFMLSEISRGVRNIKVQENNLPEKLEAFASEMNSIENLDTFNKVIFQIFDDIAEGYRNVSSSKYENIAKEVMRIIDCKYNDINLSVDNIADKVGFTASYITKIFKQHTAKTVIEYINEKRIEKAKALLLETTDNVAEISEKCGFANITYFHRAFKKTVGTTPSAYRSGSNL